MAGGETDLTTLKHAIRVPASLESPACPCIISVNSARAGDSSLRELNDGTWQDIHTTYSKAVISPVKAPSEQGIPLKACVVGYHVEVLVPVLCVLLYCLPRSH